MLTAFLDTMRPQQWTKNSFVFAAIVFAKRLADARALLDTAGAFAIFCLLSGSVYVVNDVADAESDRAHPTKRSRPIASGRLSKSAAAALAVIVAALSLGLSFMLTTTFAAIAAGYLALNLLYTFALKRIVILDVLCIAIFFVLRAAAGAAAIRVPISHWLLICTLLLALFIALSKRRHELVLLEEKAASHRASLTQYTPYLLDQMIAVVTASTLMAYALYTVDERTVAEFGSNRMMYTIPFVVFGIFRYLYLIHQEGEGGSPERIVLSDRPFLLNLLAWAGASAAIIYARQ